MGVYMQQLAKADTGVAESQTKVESDPIELADHKEPIDAGVEQQHFVEDRKMRRPRGLEPSQIDRKPQNRKHQEVAPGAALCDVDCLGLPQQCRCGNRQQRV